MNDLDQKAKLLAGGVRFTFKNDFTASQKLTMIFEDQNRRPIAISDGPTIDDKAFIRL